MMKKKYIVGIAVIAVSAGIFGFYAFKGKKNGMQFKAEAVEKGTLTATVTATGTVNPVTTVLVGTQVSGTVKDIYVDFNSPVKKGQVIARIDPSTIKAQVRQARASLLSNKANVKKAEAALSDAKKTAERNRELFAKHFISRAELDTSESNYQSAAAQMDAAKAQVEQAGAALEFADTNLKNTEIASPVNGIVISRNVDVGQTVAASFQTPTLFTIAEDLTSMQINTNVGEADIGKIATGQEAEFTVDAYPEETFRGRVSQIRNAPQTIQNVVTYDVIVTVGNPGLKLKPGMTANVSVIVSKKVNVLRVPNAALRFKPSEIDQGKQDAAKQPEHQKKKKGPAVWITENGSLRQVPMTPGISDGSYTEVLSGDIKEGQKVVTEQIMKNKKQSMGSPRFF